MQSHLTPLRFAYHMFFFLYVFSFPYIFSVYRQFGNPIQPQNSP